jgi:hypothetical protein
MTCGQCKHFKSGHECALATIWIDDNGMHVQTRLPQAKDEACQFFEAKP